MNNSFDIPVLLIFFCRNEPFEKVFECVRRIKPKKLYCYQDGPRPGRDDDIIGIEKCRQIVDSVDWECDVKKFYQEKNVGCDPSEYIAQKWMFSSEEMGIVLEDDDVVSDSFFLFCRELLIKYKDDDRINIICGMNHLGHYDTDGSDYFFTKSGAITGWASWKKIIDAWDPSYKVLENEYALGCLKRILGRKYNNRVRSWKRQKASGKEHYEGLMGANYLMNHKLNIVPRVNLVSNIGIVANATHSVSALTQLPRGIRRVFFAPVYELEFPLKHPEFVIEDLNYQDKVHRILNGRNKFCGFMRRVEGRIYRYLPFLGKL